MLSIIEESSNMIPTLSSELKKSLLPTPTSNKTTRDLTSFPEVLSLAWANTDLNG